MYRLDVPYVLQSTPYACWWASLQMLIRYHQRRHYVFPWEYHEAFRPPPGMPGSLQYNAPMTYPLASSGEEPWTWYYRGVIPETRHVNRLAAYGGLEPLELTTGHSTHGGGAWEQERLTGAWVEQKLRHAGPIYVIRRRAGGHHAFLVTGVLQRTGGPSGNGLIEIQDPWPGGRLRTQTVADLQSSLAPQLRAYNMLVLRERGAPIVMEEDDTF